MSYQSIPLLFSDCLFGVITMGLFLRARKHFLSKLFLDCKMTATTKILMSYERRSALQQRHNYWLAFLKYTCFNAALLIANQCYSSIQQPFQNISLVRQLVKPLTFCFFFKLPFLFGVLLAVSSTTIVKLTEDTLLQLL